MSTLSEEQLSRSRKMQSRILQAVEAAGQKQIALALGCDPSNVCRMKSPQGTAAHSEIEKMCIFLASLGLKVVPQEYKMLRPDVLRSMLSINKEFYRRIGDIDDLAHDELTMRDDLDY